MYRTILLISLLLFSCNSKRELSLSAGLQGIWDITGGLLLDSKEDTPNVIFILADDLGIGDIQTYNPNSKIPTPNLNQLAKDGLKFTDAHSNSSVCTPTRYGILTGTYAWRTKLKRGVLNGFSPPLIKNKELTIAEVFKKNNYHTACIGKWHLGMNIPVLPKNKTDNDKNRRVDTKLNITNSPNAHGFDYFFGISASLDFPPYGYIENNRFIKPLDEYQEKTIFPNYSRAGVKSADFSAVDTLDTLINKAKLYIQLQAKNKQKFFLYLPLTGPHKPVIPHPRFQGKTPLGDYGDFVHQVDNAIGEIINELKVNKLYSNSLIIVTSDNGSFMRNLDNSDQEDDHTTNPKVQGFYSKNHRANHIYRGTKTDIWEGGHRVPFIIHWKQGLKNKGRSESTAICTTDFFSTICNLLGYTKTTYQGIDSYSFLPLIKNKNISRPPIIHHSAKGIFSIRKDNWKLVLGNGSGGREKPIGKPFSKPYYLLNMKTDLTETYNFIEKQPTIAKNLEDEFKKIFNKKYPLNQEEK